MKNWEDPMSDEFYWLGVLDRIFPGNKWPGEKRGSFDSESAFFDQYFSGKSWKEVRWKSLGYLATNSKQVTDEALGHFLPAILTWFLKEQSESALLTPVSKSIQRLFPLLLNGFSAIQIKFLSAFWKWLGETKRVGEEEAIFVETLASLELELTVISEQEQFVSLDFRRHNFIPPRELIRRIYDAFKDVDRTYGVSWADTEVLDNYGTVHGVPIYNDADNSWHDLVTDPTWSPNPGVGGFSFLDSYGMRYYLPAAMVKMLTTRDWSSVCDMPLEDSRFALLDDAQRAVLVEFQERILP